MSSGLRILAPLRSGDFALLWSGMTISLIGDGIYFVAVAWLVYGLTNAPTALAVVGVAWTVPQILFLLVAGVTSDKRDRRQVLIASDAARAIALIALGIASLAGQPPLWLIVTLVFAYGCGEAFFMPAFGAYVPELVRADQLAQANSLDQVVRPLGLRIIGPAVGGLIVARWGAGVGLVIDGATFVISACAIALIRHRRVADTRLEADQPMWEAVRDGYRYVRSRSWIWAGLAAAAIGLLLFFGPYQVLVPFIVRNDLAGTAADLGFILGVGGLGAIVASIAVAHMGVPRNPMAFVLSVWAGGCLAMTGFAWATATWHAMIASFVLNALLTSGIIVWTTLIGQRVETRYLGRVSSFDWLVSTSLIPLSFALTGPASEAFGAKTTLVAAAVLGALATAVFVLVPGVMSKKGFPAEIDLSADKEPSAV